MVTSPSPHPTLLCLSSPLGGLGSPCIRKAWLENASLEQVAILSVRESAASRLRAWTVLDSKEHILDLLRRR